MGNKLSDDMKERIVAAMTAGVVEQLDEEAIKQVLSESLSEALNSWKVKDAANDAVEEIANREIAAYLKKPEVVERIRIESIQAIEKILTQLPLALADVLLRSLMGYSSYGGKSDTDFTRALRRYFGLPKEK